MKYTAVIFDMDGTIINSEHVWSKATRSLLQSRSIDVTPELQDYFKRRLHGVDIRTSCSIIKDHMGLDDDLDTLITEKKSLANSMYPHEVEFFDGFASFHEELVRHQCAVGLATNATSCTVQAVDTKLNLQSFFGQHIYHIEHVQGIGKPSPLLFLHAAEKLGRTPQECIVIEDSFHGVTAAKKAGMFCIGINTAKRPELLQHADMLINDYSELHVPSLLYEKAA